MTERVRPKTLGLDVGKTTAWALVRGGKLLMEALR
jgi:hypothetical protein